MSNESVENQTAYQVLARKYRPATFKDLIGQDAMVRTLKNAFESDRIAHAFVMTGVRGVGKTTTARIIAKGMNCIGPDGNGGPTISPCDQCEPCKAIAEGRHVDVMEMDAASRTGVGDIREIIDSVHYRAASARYKIYIIDEVHMLSTSAFNALLKTLEEPPEHVKFIFATTEIRKIPVTVLSRCQRFDLRRIEPEVMMSHLRNIADQESAQIAEDALALITRSAEGSVRDALSLLDQAIAHGAGETTAMQVRAMLGLADRGRVLDLFDFIMQGDAAGALTELSGQYAEGADPMAVLRDLAEITHWVSVIKISPEAADDPTVAPDERERGKAAATDLPMRALTRMWQMLLKALEEVGNAPNAMMAAEMAIIRLTHVADLPSPEELIRKLQDGPQPTPPNGGGAPAPNGGGDVNMGAAGSVSGGSAGTTMIAGSNAAVAIAQPEEALARYARFDQVVELIRARRDMRLLVEVETYFRLASYKPGRIEFQPTDEAPNDLAQRLGQRLQTWTGARWGVTLVNDGGGATINELRLEERDNLQAEAEEHPLVKAALSTFEGAEILEVRKPEDIDSDEFLEEIPEVDDDWDPFEDD
ncbi:DNA polymerase III subunit gamma/tau [Amylibacter kogurei]|uniref:DNA polymerase III subunit gamma/tau n=1 Tax=Paramylibacter kogurei TaxID=1889778 RepID=A0A2G5K933_9RHOB|nr:DNA polymerase III subunit gamma/tau [Amylibacter kogurei]PIB26051.1 DNA polymerase III subunit gamma/tau [Amylibacter kogurei]